jgi:dTDP-4-amino-4,6-dideoxygalactose transaminase
MPAFLAAVGLEEVRRWPQVAEKRKAVLRGLLDVAQAGGLDLPLAYRDSNIDIVPLRLAWSRDDGEAMRNSLSSFVDVTWTWFMEPIVGTSGLYEGYGYHAGDCPVAEAIGPRMVNLPCNIAGDAAPLIAKFRAVLHAPG